MSSSFKSDLADALRSKDYAKAIRLLEQSRLPDRAERIAKIRERMAADDKTALDAQIDRAKTLIQDGKWNEARGLLATLDDPVADKLLARLEQINPVQGKGQPAPVVVQSDKSFTSKLVVSVVLLFVLFIPGLIATSIFAGEASRYRDAPGAMALIWLNRIIWGFFLVVVVLGVLSILLMQSIPDSVYGL